MKWWEWALLLVALPLVIYVLWRMSQGQTISNAVSGLTDAIGSGFATVTNPRAIAPPGAVGAAGDPTAVQRTRNIYAFDPFLKSPPATNGPLPLPVDSAPPPPPPPLTVILPAWLRPRTTAPSSGLTPSVITPTPPPRTTLRTTF